MAEIDWKKRYVHNTASSYAHFIIKLFTGVLVFRAVINGFGQEAYTFWQILWSFLSYSIMLDFGIGFTIQKLVAVKTAEGKTHEIDRLFTTAFWSFTLLGVIAFAITLLLRPTFFAVFEISPENLPDFKLAYVYFTGMLATMLPLGLFSAAMMGVQKHYVFNWLSVAAAIGYYFAISHAVANGWLLSNIMLLSMTFTVLPSVVTALIVFPVLRFISLNPFKFDFSAVREQLSFSLIAYVNTCNYTVLSQSDRVVIGAAEGRVATASKADMFMYQPSAKVAQLLGGMAMQIMSVVTTAAAHIHALGEQEKLRQLYYRTNRLLFLLITPGYFLAAAYMEELVRLIMGQLYVPDHLIWIGQVTLLVTYVTHITSTAADRVLMMVGKEMVIFRFTICRLTTHIILSIVLMIYFGLIGLVAAGLISALLVNLFLLMPPVLRFLETRVSDYIHEHIRESVAPFACFFALLILLKIGWPCPADTGWLGFIHIALRGSFIMLPTLFLMRHHIKATWRA